MDKGKVLFINILCALFCIKGRIRFSSIPLCP